MTFPYNYNTSTVKNEKHEGQSCYYGTWKGHCSISFESIKKTDRQFITDAFKRNVRRKYKNNILLCEYGKKLKVEGKLQTYLEVLL